METRLSDAEKVFIIKGAEQNMRSDGRPCSAYRHITIETDVLATCTSSAHVRIGQTDVLVGVKADIGAPAASRPDQGRIEFSVDCSANASPQFEGRGGEDTARVACAHLTDAYAHSKLDLSCLGNLMVESTQATAATVADGNERMDVTTDTVSSKITPSSSVQQRCWVLNVDALILRYGGNLADALSIAAKAALVQVTLPKVTIDSIDDGTRTRKLQVDIDKTAAPVKLHTQIIANAPLLVSAYKLGGAVLVDPSEQEELCSKCAVVCGVTPAGAYCALSQTGDGSLQTDSLMMCVHTAGAAAAAVHEQFNAQMIS